MHLHNWCGLLDADLKLFTCYANTEYALIVSEIVLFYVIIVAPHVCNFLVT